MCSILQTNAFVKGRVVKSLSGHDAQSFYVVVKLDEEFIWIADGRRRKLEAPKRKNKKHVAPTKTVVPEEEFATNKKIRRVLWAFNFGSDSPVAD